MTYFYYHRMFYYSQTTLDVERDRFARLSEISASVQVAPIEFESRRNQRLPAHVFATAEQQRRLVRVGVALDMADEDDVVAAIVPVFIATLEMRRGADQHRCAAFGDEVIDLGEFVFVLVGELVRQLDLVVRQDIDDEMRSLLECSKTVRIERGAPQHERRIERHGGKGIGGHAIEPAVAAARRDDRHAGREGAERAAEIAQVEPLGRRAFDRCGVTAFDFVYHSRTLRAARRAAARVLPGHRLLR